MEVGALRSGDPERLGRYALIGRVGEGGQGTVFLAEDGDGGRVAVKLLHAELTSDDKARARFLRELEVAKRVAPFCTAQVIDADATGDRPYIVSEYVPGPSLNQLVNERGPLGGAALERLAVGTATALAAIHQAEIIHRDFKPHNVLIGSDGPRVIDFGVARAISGSTTLTSKVIGTPSYMAPEQIQGDEVGTAADVFCWAATVAFAATGEPPFGQDTIPAVINRILHHEPELGDLDGALRDLVADCLSKEPGDRPNARQLLMRLLGHEEPAAAVPAAVPAAAETEADADTDDATAILAAGSVLAAELSEEEARAAASARPSRAGAARGAGRDDAASTQVAGLAFEDEGGAGDAGDWPDRPRRKASGAAAGAAPSPAEWAAQNTLPPDLTAGHGGAAGGGPGGGRGSRAKLAHPRRAALLAGAAALVIAASTVSTVLAMDKDEKDKTGQPVSSHQPVPPASVAPDDTPTLPARHVPQPQDRPTGELSPTPTPSATPSGTGSPTPTDDPSTPGPGPTRTTTPPTPTDTPTTPDDPPTDPTDPGSGGDGTGSGGGSGTGTGG
ncbi:protein kinase [Actinomadura viridis]|uniref:serine/threonine-protein kinase n=1 Tax=Actinomadura viridis TaxID=58110 RepID=UPI0036C2A256